jgi:hypothetical protein
MGTQCIFPVANFLPSLGNSCSFFLFIFAFCRNIDQYMAAKTPFPSGHPSVDPYVCIRPVLKPAKGQCPSAVDLDHPNVDKAINDPNAPFPDDHPTTQTLLSNFIPPTHR